MDRCAAGRQSGGEIAAAGAVSGTRRASRLEWTRRDSNACPKPACPGGAPGEIGKIGAKGGPRKKAPYGRRSGQARPGQQDRRKGRRKGGRQNGREVGRQARYKVRHKDGGQDRRKIEQVECRRQKLATHIRT